MAAVLAFAGGSSPARLALVGLAVTAACAAVTELMLLHSQPAAATAITWLSGSTYATCWSDLRLLAVPAAVLLPVAFLAVRRLDVLMLDDELGVARSACGCGRTATLAARRGRRAGRGGGRGLRGDRVRRPARARTPRGCWRAATTAARCRWRSRSARCCSAWPIRSGAPCSRPTEIPSGLVVSMIGAPYLAVLLWRSRTA